MLTAQGWAIAIRLGRTGEQAKRKIEFDYLAIVKPLNHKRELIRIKIIHTVIWALFVGIIGYVLWSGITANITVYSWMAVAAVIGEGVVLMMNKGRCPLTAIARNYTEADASNFDIYLPEWLARYNKQIFTSLFLIGLVLMIVRSI